MLDKKQNKTKTSIRGSPYLAQSHHRHLRSTVNYRIYGHILYFIWRYESLKAELLAAYGFHKKK